MEFGGFPHHQHKKLTEPWNNNNNNNARWREVHNPMRTTTTIANIDIREINPFSIDREMFVLRVYRGVTETGSESACVTINGCTKA